MRLVIKNESGEPHMAICYEVVWYDGYWATSGMASDLVFSNGVGYERGRIMEYDHKAK